MTANAHNERSSWTTALRLCLCTPLNCFGDKHDQDSAGAASKETLNEKTSTTGQNGKTTTETTMSIIYKEPPSTPHLSTIPELMSQRSSYYTTLEMFQDDGISLRSKLVTPTPPPKALARYSKNLLDESQIFSSQIQPGTSKTHRQSWPCVVVLTDADKSAVSRRSCPMPEDFAGSDAKKPSTSSPKKERASNTRHQSWPCVLSSKDVGRPTESRRSCPMPTDLAGLNPKLRLTSSSKKERASHARHQSWPGASNLKNVGKPAESRRSCPIFRILARSKSADLSPYSSPDAQEVSRARAQSWPCVSNCLDENKSTNLRRSLPLEAFHHPHFPTSPTLAESPSSISCQEPKTPTARPHSMPLQAVEKRMANLPADITSSPVDVNGRSRPRSLPLQKFFAKVDNAASNPALSVRGDGTKNSLVSGRPHIYRGNRSATMSPTPQTPLSFDVSLSKFPLPPSRPLLLEPVAPPNRNSSLSFVSHWLYLQTNESFATLDSDTHGSTMTTEILK